jgi:small subunit ribosomal protein S20
MARTQSAIKQMRKSIKHREVNRLHLGRLRTSLKKLRAALQSGKADEANKLLPETFTIIDKSIHAGVLHRNAGARQKSRLTIQVNRLLQKAQHPG